MSEQPQEETPVEPEHKEYDVEDLDGEPDFEAGE